MPSETTIGLNAREILIRVASFAPGQEVRVEFPSEAKLQAFRSHLYLTRARELDRIQREYIARLTAGVTVDDMPFTGWESVTTRKAGRSLYIGLLGPADAVKVTWPDAKA